MILTKRMKTRFNRCFGFTIIELVIVIVIIGIITAVSAPRFFTMQTFDERGYYDEVVAAVRYAHKGALSTGCNFKVAITASGYEITKYSGCYTGTFQPIQNPAMGTAGYTGTKPGSVSSGALSFYFDNNGQPFTLGGAEISSVSSVTIGSRTLQLEPYTGFVHN